MQDLPPQKLRRGQLPGLWRKTAQKNGQILPEDIHLETDNPKEVSMWCEYHKKKIREKKLKKCLKRNCRHLKGGKNENRTTGIAGQGLSEVLESIAQGL